MAFRFPLQLPRWNRLKWRQKSLLLTWATCGFGLLVAVVVVGLWQLEKASIRIWISLTFVPFVFIVVLGAMARIHQQIDMRAGRKASRILESNDQ